MKYYIEYQRDKKLYTLVIENSPQHRPKGQDRLNHYWMATSSQVINGLKTPGVYSNAIILPNDFRSRHQIKLQMMLSPHHNHSKTGKTIAQMIKEALQLWLNDKNAKIPQ